MRIEPTFDHTLLADALRRDYGLSVERLTFTPQGEVAFSYVVTCADQYRYYLKILDDSRLARLSAQRMDFYLPLTYELHARSVFPYLPCPIKTRRGVLYTTIDAHPAILFSYIEGENPDEASLHSPACGSSWRATWRRCTPTQRRLLQIVLLWRRLRCPSSLPCATDYAYWNR